MRRNINSWLTTFGKLGFRKPARRPRSGQNRVGGNHARANRFELLEDRRLLAYTVDSPLDVDDQVYTPGNLSLREAIFLANQNPNLDTINFAASLNNATLEIENSELVINTAITIDGRDQYGFFRNITLDAGGGQDGDNMTPDGYRIFRISSYSGIPDVGIFGLTLTGGNAPDDGGAIQVYNANLTIYQTTITGNASSSGGGISSSGGSLSVEYSTISENFAYHQGGAINYYQPGSVADLQIVGSTISGNTSRSRGGGLYAYVSGGSVNIEGSTFDRNKKTTYYYGGAMFLKSSGTSITITDTIVSNNEARGPAANTGGIFLYARASSNVVMDGLKIVDNVADDDGGGLFFQGQLSHLTLRNSTISGNSAADNDQSPLAVVADGGGGIALMLDAATVTMENCTVSDNKAIGYPPGNPLDTNGGGMIIDCSPASSVTIINSTISGNRADGFGGGIRINTDFQGGQVAIRNSTITNNRANVDNDSLGTGGGISRPSVSTSVSVNHTIVAGNFRGTTVAAPADNIVGSVTTTSSFTSGNPLLGPLADNGGPTLTHLPRFGSPVIDAGSASPSPTPPPLDQRGATRIVDGNSDQVNRIDIGAVEAPYIIVSTPVDEKDTDYSAGDLSLREALEIAFNRPGQDIIVFASNVVTAGAITLSYDGPDGGTAVDLVDINSDVVIEGPGFSALTINGNYAVAYVFRLVAGANDVELKGLHVKQATYSGIAKLDGGQPHLLLDGMKVSLNSNNGSGSGVEFRLEGSVTIRNSEIVDNWKSGVNFYTAGLLTIENSLIADNDSVGVSVSLAGAKIYNSTITGNTTTTSMSAGVLAGMAGVTLINSTIAKNRSDINKAGTTSGVGGIFADNSSSITLHNTIVADNSAGASNQVLRDIGRATSGNPGVFSSASSFNWIEADPNDAWIGISGSGNRVEQGDPQLLALAGNGGATRTLALAPTSPAIDQGSDSRSDGAGLTTDQRGFTRKIDSAPTNGTGGFVDMGAYEFGAGIVASSLADENDGDYSAGKLSLREALGLANQLAGDDTILFASSMFADGPGTITLSYDGPDSGTTADSLFVSGVVISGPGSDALSISGNNQNSVVNVPYSGTTTIRGLRITGGAASAGAGITSSGTLTLDGVQVEGNSASSLGGGIASSGALTLINSTVAGNNATSAGGGIFVTAGTAVVKNSTISGNSAPTGGGMYVDMGTLQMVNATVTANRANSGSGILGGGTLHNSIVAGNLLFSGAATTNDILGWFAGSTFNLIGCDGSMYNGLNNGSGNNQVGGEYGGGAIDAHLSALEYHGGTTKTHRLLSGSAAIDAGNNAVALAYALEADQRGCCRVVDCMEDDEDACIDLGAVELAFDEI